MSELFYTSPTGEAAEMLARAEAVEILVPDSMESTRESSLELIPFPEVEPGTTIILDSTESTRESSPAISPTSTIDPIITFIGGVTPADNRVGPRVEPVIRISEKPSRDSYVEGNSPICNLEASGTPLKYSPHGDTSPPLTEVITPPTTSKTELADAQMANNTQACQPGLDEEAKAEIQHYEAETEAMIQKAAANPLLIDAAELSIVARVVEAVKNKPIVMRTPALIGGFNGKFQESSRYKTPEEEDTCISAQGSQATGANATPIGPQKATPPKESTPLAHGKPGRIQRTYLGKGYWEKGPDNTIDIEITSIPMSVQVLITGCPSIPAKGDEWKRSFLAGFNAKREYLAPETPICATQVSFVFSYPTERVVTIYHPANMKHEEIIRAVARVRREMYNNYIQYPNQSMISILQETTELVAPGLQGIRGEKAWDRADPICKDLKLVRAARPLKWLVKGKGDRYEGKKCSLRFSVTMASL
ncbi:hypothetical protein L211DRAFT_852797 [Terfezia boudieri ATCC MYA-4762]|uniref:Uncharacterized protein n=1 Tax=Terfezia boudieri ATCC MYA-4762 TaxID=1051890 RepID=A0A3N4LAJ4_9PEZI|nr:hypothetical protein L211DRAFT_852797 [Terfezia boudieri ATCC MYA-4762]